MNSYDELAELIFPNIKETIEDLEKRFPARNLPEGAEVTRFAPSPTGFLHTGSLFTAMIAHKIANQSNGVFYVRLEDTDTKREIEGSGLSLLNQLKVFNVYPSEGYFGDHEKGDYGPYVQSQRASIYNTVIKELIRQNKAYPCFCTPEEIDEIRKVQEEQKLIPGYYGEYAKCRNLTPEEAINRIKAGEKYVIRFKSNGNHLNKITVKDYIRGNIEIAQNDMDIVIMKSDGLPTYHFAHAVDDHFMHTTIVTRGEEWISSLPIHVDLFKSIGWKAPKYAHLPVIMKLDNGNRRKLSKRKDNEAAVQFFIENGYPCESLLVYLMSIANSNFEEWTLANKSFDLTQFKYQLSKMSLDGALFDIDKLNYFSKEVIAKLSADELCKRVISFSNLYNKDLYNRIMDNVEYFTSIINIDRNKDKPRKDFTTYNDTYSLTKFFYDDYYEMINEHHEFNENISKEDIKNILLEVKEKLTTDGDEQSWFNIVKEIAIKYGFAESGKIYKANPELYKGTVGDVAEILRIVFTSNKNSPTLFYVMKILGKNETDKRIDYVIENILN